MEINNAIKLAIIMVLELIVITTATNYNNSGFDHIDFVSVTCVVECRAACKGEGWHVPICLAKCLHKCKDSPVVSEDVPVCTSACAQFNCSKFVGSGN